jgi:prophage regulatory protein
VKKLIKIKGILERIPVSRTHIYNMIAAGKFPRPTHLGGYGSFWDSDEVDAWIQAHLDAREPNRDSNPGDAAAGKMAQILLVLLRVEWRTPLHLTENTVSGNPWGAAKSNQQFRCLSSLDCRPTAP